jgi:hypothetical protein
MKIVKVEKDKILFKKADGTDKYFNVPASVVAKAQGKEGCSCKPTFENFKITDLTIYDKKAYTAKAKKSYGGGDDTYYGRSQELMVERSVYASVANIVSELDEVNIVNVQDVIEKLFAQGMQLVRGPVATGSAKAETKVDDDDEVAIEDTEKDIEDEEEIEEE